MTRIPLLSATPLFMLAVLVMSGCGSGNRKLQSVALSPSSASGQAQFTATGTFSEPPSPATLTSKDIVWCTGGNAASLVPESGLCDGNIAAGVSVNQNGAAQCNSGFVGSWIVLAGTPSTQVSPDTGEQLKVFGSATLSCP